MTQEKAGDKVVETQDVVVEPILSPQEELDALKQQLTETGERLVKAEEEAKSHQRVASKKAQELEEQSNLRSEIEGIKGQLEMTQALIAELGEKGETDGEPGQTPSFKVKVQAAQIQRQRETFGRRSVEIDGKIDELLKDTGLSKDSPEMEAAAAYWNTGIQTGNVQSLEAALQKTKKLVENLKPKEETVEIKKETEDERVNRLADEKLQVKMIEAGLLTPEGGTPSAASTRKSDVIKRYAEGDPSVSREDYEKAIKS